LVDEQEIEAERGDSDSSRVGKKEKK